MEEDRYINDIDVMEWILHEANLTQLKELRDLINQEINKLRD